MAKKKAGKKEPIVEKPPRSDNPTRLIFPDTVNRDEIESWAKAADVKIPIEFQPEKKPPKRKKTSKAFDYRMKIIRERRKKFGTK